MTGHDGTTETDRHKQRKPHYTYKHKQQSEGGVGGYLTIQNIDRHKNRDGSGCGGELSQYQNDREI